MAEQLEVEKQAGFSYRMAIRRELIYAFVAARLDISFAVIKLSQYSASPAAIHYPAIRHDVFAYLSNTKTEGLTYWRRTLRDDLPDLLTTTSAIPSYECSRKSYCSICSGYIGTILCLGLGI